MHSNDWFMLRKNDATMPLGSGAFAISGKPFPVFREPFPLLRGSNPFPLLRGLGGLKPTPTHFNKKNTINQLTQLLTKFNSL